MPIVSPDQIKFDDKLPMVKTGIVSADGIKFDDASSPVKTGIVSSNELRFDDELKTAGPDYSLYSAPTAEKNRDVEVGRLSEYLPAIATGLPAFMLGAPSKLGVALRYAIEGRKEPAKQAIRDVDQFLSPILYEPKTSEGQMATTGLTWGLIAMTAPELLPFLGINAALDTETAKSTLSEEQISKLKIASDMGMIVSPILKHAIKEVVPKLTHIDTGFGVDMSEGDMLRTMPGLKLSATEARATPENPVSENPPVSPQGANEPLIPEGQALVPVTSEGALKSPPVQSELKRSIKPTPMETPVNQTGSPPSLPAEDRRVETGKANRALVDQAIAQLGQLFAEEKISQDGYSRAINDIWKGIRGQKEPSFSFEELLDRIDREKAQSVIPDQPRQITTSISDNPEQSKRSSPPKEEQARTSKTVELPIQRNMAEGQELYTFPGPIGRALRFLEDKIGEVLKKAIEISGAHTAPWMKETLEYIAGTDTGTTNRYPKRKGIYKANIQRGENNAEESHFVFSPDATGYKGADPVRKLSRKEREIFDRIRIAADTDGGPLLTAKQLESMGANPAIMQAYWAERMMYNRLSALIAYKIEQLGLIPYETEPWFGELKRHVEDIKAGRTRQVALIKDQSPEQRRAEAYAEKLQDPAIPAPIKLALRHVNPFLEKSQYYMVLPEINANYFPRVRDDGEYHVRVFKSDANGNPVEVFMKPAPNLAAAMVLEAKIKADPAEYMKLNYSPGDVLTYSIGETKQLPEDIYNDAGSAARMALFDRAANLAVAKGNITLADKEALSNAALEVFAMRGAGRHFLHRAIPLIEGYETKNLNKVMTSNITGIIAWLNKAEYSIRAMQEMKQLEHRYDQRWAESYFHDSMKNMDAFDRTVANLRGLAVFNYLGFVARSAGVNFFDYYQKAVPVFSKYTRTALLQLERARKDVLSGNLTDAEKSMLARLHDKGLDAAALMRDISGTNDMAPSAGRNVIDASMSAFQWVETTANRKPSILAAMRLFTGAKDGNGKLYGSDKNGAPYRMSALEAESKTIDFMDESHGRYGRENRPELVRKLGAIGSALYSFMAWSAEYLNTQWTAAVKGNFNVIWRMLMASALLGGIKATPAAEQIDEALAKWFGYPLWHRIRTNIRAWLSEKNVETGKANTIEDFIMGGIPEALSMSLSRSISLNIPFVGGQGDLSERIGGALFGLGKKYSKAVGSATEQDWFNAAKYAAPEGLANWMKAYQGYNKGLYTSSGYPLLDEGEKTFKYTGGEAIKKGLGITSTRESKLRESDFELSSLEGYYENKKIKLEAQYRSGGPMERKLLRSKIDDFNRELSTSDVVDRVDPISESNLINAELKHEGTPARISISRHGVTVAPDQKEIRRRSAREKFISGR